MPANFFLRNMRVSKRSWFVQQDSFSRLCRETKNRFRRRDRPGVLARPHDQGRILIRRAVKPHPRMIDRQRPARNVFDLDEHRHAFRETGRNEKTSACAEAEQAAPCFWSRRQDTNRSLVALQQHLLEAEGTQAGAVHVRAGGQSSGPNAGIAAVPSTVGEPVILLGVFAEQPRGLVGQPQPRGPDGIQRPAIGDAEDAPVERVNADVAVG